MNKSGITEVTGTAPTQILFNVQNQVSVSVKVSNAGVSANAEGRKIVKAGTPLNGNLTARGTAFVLRADTTNPAVGVLLHDVDVTDGAANGALLIWGFVDFSKLTPGVTSLITANAKTELAGKVTFLV